jgi:hypothetical protein
MFNEIKKRFEKILTYIQKPLFKEFLLNFGLIYFIIFNINKLYYLGTFPILIFLTIGVLILIHPFIDIFIIKLKNNYIFNILLYSYLYILDFFYLTFGFCLKANGKIHLLASGLWASSLFLMLHFHYFIIFLNIMLLLFVFLNFFKLMFERLQYTENITKEKNKSIIREPLIFNNYSDLKKTLNLKTSFNNNKPFFIVGQIRQFSGGSVSKIVVDKITEPIIKNGSRWLSSFLAGTGAGTVITIMNERQKNAIEKEKLEIQKEKLEIQKEKLEIQKEINQKNFDLKENELLFNQKNILETDILELEQKLSKLIDEDSKTYFQSSKTEQIATLKNQISNKKSQEDNLKYFKEIKNKIDIENPPNINPKALSIISEQNENKIFDIIEIFF